jgi:hypothetical protein
VVGDLGSSDTRSAVHAVESGGQSSVANAHLLLNLLIAETPLEHESAHAQTFASLAEGGDHLLNVVASKELAPAAAHATHGALALVLEEPSEHLVEELEVGLGDAELLAQLRDDIAGEGLARANAFREASFDGEENLASVEEIVSEDVEAVGLLGNGAEILKHTDRDTVTDRGGLMAELQARGLSLGRTRHAGALLGG